MPLKLDDAVIAGLSVEVVPLESDWGFEIFRRSSVTDAELQTTVDKKELGKSLRQIFETNYPPRKFAVKGLVYVGCTILSGMPKVGKSYYALQLAACVASGKDFLGKPTRQGTVLYLALEDDNTRISERATLMGYNCAEEALVQDNLRVIVEEEWEEHRKDPIVNIMKYGKDCDGELSLIIIDTLQCFRGLDMGEGNNIYGMDNDYMSKLRKLSTSIGTPILLLHHTKKSSTGDYITDGSGSLGIAGGATCVIGMYRQHNQNHAVIKGGGKDVMPFEEWVCWDHDYARFHAVPEQDVPDEAKVATQQEVEKPSKVASTELLICRHMLTKAECSQREIVEALKNAGSNVAQNTVVTTLTKLVNEGILIADGFGTNKLYKCKGT